MGNLICKCNNVLHISIIIDNLYISKCFRNSNKIHVVDVHYLYVVHDELDACVSSIDVRIGA